MLTINVHTVFTRIIEHSPAAKNDPFGLFVGLLAHPRCQLVSIKAPDAPTLVLEFKRIEGLVDLDHNNPATSAVWPSHFHIVVGLLRLEQPVFKFLHISANDTTCRTLLSFPKRLELAKIALLLLAFCDLKIPALQEGLTPGQLAEQCHDLYRHVLSPTHGSIHKQVTSHFMKPMGHENVEALTKLFEYYQKQPTQKCLNEPLLKAIWSKSHPFIHSHARLFCAEQHSAVHAQLKNLLGHERFKMGSPKAVYRLEQKYREYGADTVDPHGPLPYASFKDLFRATVTIKDFSEEAKTAIVEHLVECKFPSVGYTALYLILKIEDMKCELQVVTDFKAADDAHSYYELQRNDSMENLELFVFRDLEKQTQDALKRTEDEIRKATRASLVDLEKVHDDMALISHAYALHKEAKKRGVPSGVKMSLEP